MDTSSGPNSIVASTCSVTPSEMSCTVQVLVLFYGDGEFESIAVSSKATAEDIINDTELQIQLDKAGINNRLTFLVFEVTCFYLSVVVLICTCTVYV